MSDADLLPDDDSFVRTAIQGLRAPTHLPDFWDQLAWRLDDALDEMTGRGLMEFAVRDAPVADLAEPEPSPHHVEDPWPEPEIDLFAPVDEPVYDDEDEDDEDDGGGPPAPEPPARRAPLRARDQVFVDAPTAVAPAPKRVATRLPRVQQDRAVVPMSLRRASNAVLLALALLAAVLAIVAGLTLVRQRSEAGSSTPSEQASDTPDPGAPALPDLAA